MQTDKQRQKLVDEINQTRQVIAKSNSEKFKRDRIKHLNYLMRELNDYDRFKKQAGRL